MHRRTLLTRVSAGLGAVALARCVADENGDGETPDESETGTKPPDQGNENVTDVSLADATLTPCRRQLWPADGRGRCRVRGRRRRGECHRHHLGV